jgi:hypothetical protein
LDGEQRLCAWDVSRVECEAPCGSRVEGWCITGPADVIAVGGGVVTVFC